MKLLHTKKGEPNLYKIISSGLVLFMVVSGFMLFLSYGSEEYDVINYDSANSDLQFLKNESNNFKNIAPTYNNASSAEIASDDPDKEGTLLGRARSALSTTTNSITFFTKITSRLASMLGLGEFGSIVSDVAVALIIIVLILFIAVAAIFRVKI